MLRSRTTSASAPSATSPSAARIGCSATPPKGAKASAAVYSIIETAKANGLNPFQYLKYLFEHLPNADIQRHPEHLDDVLPWNEIIQQNCK